MTNTMAQHVTTDGEERTVRIPAELAARVEDRLEVAEYDTVDEYVAFVLREVLSRAEGPSKGDVVDGATVQERLESLGYLE